MVRINGNIVFLEACCGVHGSDEILVEVFVCVFLFDFERLVWVCIDMRSPELCPRFVIRPMA